MFNPPISKQTNTDSNEKELFDEYVDLIEKREFNSIPTFLDGLGRLISKVTCEIETNYTEVIINDKDFMNEVKTFSHPNATLLFGKTLRDLKFVITSDKDRKHEVWIQYISPKILRITDLGLPSSSIENQCFKSLGEVVEAFLKHLKKLSNYFEQLDRIQQVCGKAVMEPVKPTYKEDYRKIQLVDKIWLHIEVSQDGSVKKMQCVGQLAQQNDILRKMLLDWDHDMDIATYVMKIASKLNGTDMETMQAEAIKQPCRICLSTTELILNSGRSNGVPQPLCNDTACGAYYHRICLYEYLVFYTPDRPPSHGVAIGKCPTCQHPIQCSDRDF